MSRWFPDHLELRFGDAPASTAASGVPALAGQVVAGKLDAALIAFERELDALDPPRGTRITCVLAGEGVRYRVVPWRDDLASPAQRQLLATQCFAEAYGEAARSWTVRQNAGSHGAATLACAVDSTLLDRIDAMTQARGLRLVSMQPSLMHAFNRVRGRIEAELFWFVCVEGPWTTLLLTTGDEPLHVKVLPTASGELSRLLDREWFALGIDAARCPVVVSRLVDGAEASSGLAPTLVKGWQVIDLDAGVERRTTAQPVAPVASVASVAAQPAASAASAAAQPAAVASPAAAPAVAPVVQAAAPLRPSAAAPIAVPDVVVAPALVPAPAPIPVPAATPVELPLAATPAASSKPASLIEPAVTVTAVPDRSSHLVETTIVNATPKSIEPAPASLPAPMSASIHATMPAPLVARPWVPVSAEPRPQPAPPTKPAVVESVPAAVPEPEPVSLVAIPQFEWWSAPAAAVSSSPARSGAPASAAQTGTSSPHPKVDAPAATSEVAAPAVLMPVPMARINGATDLSAHMTTVPAQAAPIAVPASTPVAAATAPAARTAQVPSQPLATTPVRAVRTATAPTDAAVRSASAPRPAPMARPAAAELAASTATDAAVDHLAQTSEEDDAPAPRKWTSFFRRRPKAPDAAKPSAPPEDDMPVPRWVNGRWESS